MMQKYIIKEVNSFADFVLKGSKLPLHATSGRAKRYDIIEFIKMRNNPKPFDKILKGITSGWISITKDHRKVIAHGKTLDDLVKKLEKRGNPEGVITRVTTGFSSYVG